MEYITRHLTSDPGMDQREALTMLQKDANFKPGSIVSSIRNRRGQWVAEILEPKTAGDDEAPEKDGGPEDGPEPKSDGGPPPFDDGGDEGPPSGEGGGPDGPGDGDKPGGDKPEGKGSVDEQILHTLQQLLHVMQGGGAPPVGGGPDALGPGGPPGGPPPPKGPPPGMGGPPMPGKGGPPPGGPMGGGKMTPRPMKPGDTPPGGTPVGAPAFSHTHTAEIMPGQGTPVPAGQAGPTMGGVCPQCGGAEPCPMHSGGGAAGGMGLPGQVASFSGRSATITLTREGTDIKSAVEEARPVVENFGYKVKQAKRSDDGTQVHILASRR